MTMTQIKSGDCHDLTIVKSRNDRILKVFRQPENEVLMKSKRVSTSEAKLKRSFSETKTLFDKVKKSFCKPQGEAKMSFCERSKAKKKDTVIASLERSSRRGNLQTTERKF